MLDLKNLSQEINSKTQQITDRQSLESLKTFYLGKKGVITEAFKNMGAIDANQRKNFAAELNIIKTNLLNEIISHESKIELKEIDEKLNSEKIDITLPTKKIIKGKIHPVSQVIDELTCIFAEIGFSVAEGPDIENEFNNFTALNTPEHHPARDMHDTFYLDENKKKLLRTHTSPVQIRTMLNNKPPIKIIAPGRTYRCDSDMTHTPMFHQLEGLHIDRDVNMGNLKGCLDFFLKKFFEDKNLELRFKIDPKKFQGYAFGVGIDRLAMLKYGITDLRSFFEGDLRWSNHYGFDANDVPTNYRGLSK